ncbi:hepatocellular carcinoma-associated antigen 59-domain-containing protein [Mucor lusitanicus]|uniref:Hepatocellular carcinoma-associated antigen 59-domain-containing protein n=2 Tax=Mucor circinelloides f. lusitanicus TaxID=29924 RepID=A0A8H4EWU2_MUCCL|nr:hepatocellular carcinoma-associated antigen 59-domain-containing protein [Mucor lusitanicus]
MSTVKKQKNYRKKKVESDDELEATREHTPELEQVSATIEELTELRKLRRKPVGLDAEKLLKGAEKKKKKKKIEDPNAWSLKKGGLVEPDAYRASKLDDEESANKSRKLKLDAFATATNTLDVDKHMMEYIESEMKKRRGGTAKDDDEDEDQVVDRGLVDIYEELYRIPDRLKGEQKQQEPEGNVQLSTQMLTAIPEVDLGIDTRLQNIEETERAKRKLIDDTEKEESESSGQQNAADHVPANFEKQIPKQYKPRLDHKLMATDDQAVARFKKRMRK